MILLDIKKNEKEEEENYNNNASYGFLYGGKYGYGTLKIYQLVMLFVVKHYNSPDYYLM
jgi:hypothetical protein